MQIRVTPAGQPSFDTSLEEFADANEIAPDELTEIVGQLTAGYEYVGGGGAAPFFVLVKINPALAPFHMGERVLRRDRPWDGSWLVTDCKRVNDRWRVYLQSGTATGHDAASAYLLAPEDWIEPPVHPIVANDIIQPHTTSARLDSEDARIAYYRRYAAWGRKHLAPLGFEEHVARFESFIARHEAERAEAAE